MVYAEAIHQGAGFKLKTKTDGKVSIKQLANNRSKKDIGSYAFRSGEFFKVLDVGTYEFSVETQGKKYTFETEVVKGMIMPNGNYTEL
jgi:hypothetical protein